MLGSSFALRTEKALHLCTEARERFQRKIFSLPLKNSISMERFLAALILSLFVCFQIVMPGEAVNVTVSEDFFLQQKYMEMDKGLKQMASESLKYLLKMIPEAYDHVNISSYCIRNLMKLAGEIKQLKHRSVSFVDASGKLSEGLLRGDTQMLGNYDQCLSSAVYKKNGELDFRGRYCLIMYKPYLPNPDITPGLNEQMQKAFMAVQNVSEIVRNYILKSQAASFFKDYYGLCIPSGCAAEDVDEITKFVGERISLNLTLQYCQTEADTPRMNRYGIAVICVFSVLGFLGVLGTMIEYYCRVKNMKPENSIPKILICFSLLTNFPKLMDSNTPDSSLSCLAGIRVLTIFYIILGHHYLTNQLIFAKTNFFDYMLRSVPGFFGQIVANGFLSVDVFFLVGGFIHCYLRINEQKKEKTISRSPYLIIHRLWRLYPAYISSILVFLILTPRGPLSTIYYKDYLDLCKTEWWKNLLFINNFFDQTKVCLPDSWYLACDMQLFLISLFTIPFLKSHPKIGVAIHMAIIIVCLICTTAWIWIENLPPTFLSVQFSLKTLLTVSRVYMSPISHASSYFMGVLLGYLVAKNKNIKMSKLLQFLGWFLAALSFTSMLFMTQRWNSGVAYSAGESAFYFAFSKPLYAGGVAWLLLCCVTGHGGVINYILSLKLWFPLSRLSFTVFLVSFPIQLYFCANKRTTIDTHPMILIWMYFGDLCVSCLLSLALVLLAESPFHALEKLMLKKRENDPRENDRNVREGGRENEAFENHTDSDIGKNSNSINTTELNLRNLN